MRDDYQQNCMLILDGVFASSTNLSLEAIDHNIDRPVIYLGLPGRLLNLDVTFGYDEMQDAYTYVDLNYLTDTWAASFSHHVIRELFDEDPRFRRAVIRSEVQIASDACQIAALFRSNYTYYGLYHLVEILTQYSQFITQQQLADLMNLDRTSISKAVSRFKKEHPDIWEAYTANRRHEPTRPNPGETI